MASSFLLCVILLVAVLGHASALPCSACDHVIESAGGTYTIVDNADLGLAAGSIVCWSASNTYDTGFFLRNFTGNSSNRFVFTNCGGTAVIDTASHGIITQRCRYIRVTGKYETNSTTDYGLRITRSAKGVAFEEGSTFVELDHVELTNSIGHASIIAKTDPTVNGGEFVRPDFVMEDVWLHHNYIHDVDTEAFYIGYFNFEESDAHEIHGLRLFNNIIENTGWDGIQVGCAISDTKVYNNYVTNYGTENELYQNSGIILLTGFKGEVYGNKVNNGPGIGILYHGNLDSSIYNNVVLNADGGGISASVDSARTNAGTYTAYHHNTIVGYGGNGLNIYITTAGHTYHAFNNVIIGGGTCTNRNDLDDSNLCATSVSSDMRFTDPSTADYSLQANSSLIDQGVTCTPNAITTDWNEGTRTAPPDLGAFEYGTAPRDDDGGLVGDGNGGDGSSAASSLIPLLASLVAIMASALVLLALMH